MLIRTFRLFDRRVLTPNWSQMEMTNSCKQKFKTNPNVIFGKCSPLSLLFFLWPAEKYTFQIWLFNIRFDFDLIELDVWGQHRKCHLSKRIARCKHCTAFAHNKCIGVAWGRTAHRLKICRSIFLYKIFMLIFENEEILSKKHNGHFHSFLKHKRVDSFKDPHGDKQGMRPPQRNTQGKI
jgi:hypothetical protein